MEEETRCSGRGGRGAKDSSCKSRGRGGGKGEEEEEKEEEEEEETEEKEEERPLANLHVLDLRRLQL